MLLSLDPVKGDLSLPGWDESYNIEELRTLLDAYKSVDKASL